jgi:hypothetical protein
MQIPKSDFMQLVERIEPEFLGAILIVAVVFSFVTLIVTIVSFTQMIQKITIVRTNHRLIEHLLAQGMSADDIERLVFGKKRWPSLSKMMRRHNIQNAHPPVAPVKPLASTK